MSDVADSTDDLLKQADDLVKPYTAKLGLDDSLKLTVAIAKHALNAQHRSAGRAATDLAAGIREELQRGKS